MKNLNVFVNDEALERMRDVVRSELAEILPPLIKKAIAKDFFTQREVREQTGFSARKLHYLRKTEKLEYVQNGNSILYPAESLFEFLENHRVRGGK